jgi:uncharacterized repeat protein (TIGR03803 family)
MSTKRARVGSFATLILVLATVVPVFAGHKEKVLHTFYDKPAANPESNLIFDAHGNLYGSTANSGSQACKCGTIFRLSPEAGGKWNYRVLYEFEGKDDGGYPVGSLAFDDADNLYGVSAFGYGSIFRLTQQSDGSCFWILRALFAVLLLP